MVHLSGVILECPNGECCPARYFYYNFPRFRPQVHHCPTKPQAGECDDNRVGKRPRTGLPSTRGPKELPEVDCGNRWGLLWRLGTRDTKGDGVHRASMIGPHTPLIILQLHMPIMQKAKNTLSPMLNPITNSKRGVRTRGAKSDAP